jgi:hypothetical protein
MFAGDDGSAAQTAQRLLTTRPSEHTAHIHVIDETDLERRFNVAMRIPPPIPEGPRRAVGNNHRKRWVGSDRPTRPSS